MPDLAQLEMLRRIGVERQRQERLHEGLTCASPDLPEGGKMMVLAEEFGEVAQAACDCYNCDNPSSEQRQHLQEELIQLAAVACAWAEAIEVE